ncbi:MAG TPA: DUF2796 domain-containing protein [Accumulibacter sp.]|uniref:ZrgA family zinc uptake protein n=1 Tax=Accumulibacter sp. TaxID=2053492 RepID=UPI002BB7D270|nr:DUF2796 domain-containing protein [Accumulibacter sp.]HNB68393.1 DUF2796 domain-containing protein [Accumulibacter sp.]HNK02750.1 DUF2796 domain-containing protein [Accumulibacter sp.]
MKTVLAIAVLFLALPVCAQHVHGEGRLDVVIDRDQLTLSLELPLDAAVGFERAPRNEAERAALASAGRALHALPFAPNPTARCALQAKDISLPYLDGKAPAAGEHVDIVASYVFRCADPAALKSVETTLFKDFKRLYRLASRRVGPSGQGAMRLTPNRPSLTW